MPPSHSSEAYFPIYNIRLCHLIQITGYCHPTDSSGGKCTCTPSVPPVVSEIPRTPPVVLVQYSLRFTIALFECIRRSNLKSEAEEKAMLMEVLEIRRSRVEQIDDERGSEEVNMDWFFNVIHDCLQGDDRALEIIEGP